mgnify:CR=1 FL=1
MGDAERFRWRYGPRALVVGGSDGIGAAFARAQARAFEQVMAIPFGVALRRCRQPSTCLKNRKNISISHR